MLKRLMWLLGAHRWAGLRSLLVSRLSPGVWEALQLGGQSFSYATACISLACRERFAMPADCHILFVSDRMFLQANA